VTQQVLLSGAAWSFELLEEVQPRWDFPRYCVDMLRPLQFVRYACTPSSVNVVTSCTTWSKQWNMIYSLFHWSGESLRISISLVVDNHMPVSVACSTSSSTSDCMLLHGHRLVHYLSHCRVVDKFVSQTARPQWADQDDNKRQWLKVRPLQLQHPSWNNKQICSVCGLITPLYTHYA